MEPRRWDKEPSGAGAVWSRRLIVGLLLMGLAGCGGRCAPDELYREVALWLQTYALPDEAIAAPTGARACLGEVATADLPASLPAVEMLTMLDERRPDLVAAVDSVGWDGVRAQPWFQERYRLVRTWDRAGVTYAPVEVFAYRPSPYEGSGRSEVTGAFESDAVILRAYELGSGLPGLEAGRLRPADTVYVTLYWDAVPGMAFDGYRSSVELVAAGTGEVWARTESRLQVTGLAWQPDSRLAQHYTLLPPEALPEGDFHLIARLAAPGGRPVVYRTVEGERQEASVLVTVVHPAAVSQQPIPVASSVHYGFGAPDGALALVGYDAPERAGPGDRVPLTLIWSTALSPGEDYHVFVHLVSEDATLVAQDDGVPESGLGRLHPTSSWRGGDFVRDEHVLALPEDLLRGDYTVRVGLYHPATRDRLPAYSASGDRVADDSVRLMVIEVR